MAHRSSINNLAVTITEIAMNELVTKEKEEKRISDHVMLFNSATGMYDKLNLDTGELEASLVDICKTYSYTEEMALIICVEVAKGKTISKITANPKYPPASVIYAWKHKYPRFKFLYDLAIEQRAEGHFDRVLDIAEDTLLADSKEQIAANTAASKMFQWAAEKGHRARYGAKVESGLQQEGITLILNTGVNKEECPADIVVDSMGNFKGYKNEESDDNMGEVGERSGSDDGCSGSEEAQDIEEASYKEI